MEGGWAPAGEFADLLEQRKPAELAVPAGTQVLLPVSCSRPEEMGSGNASISVDWQFHPPLGQRATYVHELLKLQGRLHGVARIVQRVLPRVHEERQA